jgi:hypothetical protein
MNRDFESESGRLDLILNEIEIRCNPPQYLKLAESFMFDCQALVGQRMPPLALRALQVASRHRAGLIPLQSVSETLAACWRGIQGRDMQLDKPDVAAVRAVICILDSQLHPESDEFVDSLSFFLHLLNSIEPHFVEQEDLIRRHFADCLPLR